MTHQAIIGAREDTLPPEYRSFFLPPTDDRRAPYRCPPPSTTHFRPEQVELLAAWLPSHSGVVALKVAGVILLAGGSAACS